MLLHVSRPPTDLIFAARALAAAVAVAPIAAARADDAQGVASSRMSYSRFLEYLDMGRVKKVRPVTKLVTSQGPVLARNAICANVPAHSNFL